jgi:hypothetical protein
MSIRTKYFRNSWPDRQAVQLVLMRTGVHAGGEKETPKKP